MGLKSLLFGIGKLLLAIVLVLALFIALMLGVVLLNAHEKADAQAFCTRTPLGQPWADVERRIKASGADQRQSRLVTAKDGKQSAGVTFNGIFPLSRHICEITLDSGRVSARKTLFLD